MSVREKPYCGDCLERDSCAPGVPCRKMTDLFTNRKSENHQRGTKTMSKNTNVTVADAVAQAAEEKLVTVPQQNTDTIEEKNVTTDEKKTDETPELKVVEGEKKTLGQRLDAGIAKLRENRKTVLIAGASITAAAVAFAKFARKQVEEVVIETTVVTTEATDENTDGESAA